MTSNDTHAQAYIVSAVPADGSAFPYSRAVTAPGPRSAIRYAAAGIGQDAEKLAARNTARVRHHPAEPPGYTPGEREFEGITEPCAVVIRPDGSVDVYGYIGVVDQRPDVATLTAEIRAKAEQIKAMRDDPNADTGELWALRDIRDAALDLADIARPAWMNGG